MKNDPEVPGMLVLKGQKYNLNQLLGAVGTAPIVAVNESDLCTYDVIESEITFINTTRSAAGAAFAAKGERNCILFFKFEGKYLVLVGDAAIAANRGMKEYGKNPVHSGRLISTPALKKARIELDQAPQNFDLNNSRFHEHRPRAYEETAGRRNDGFANRPRFIDESIAMRSVAADEASMLRKWKENGDALFVLDTSVLMKSAEAIFDFGLSDVYIPLKVISELEGLKKGMAHQIKAAFLASEILEYVIRDQRHSEEAKTQGKYLLPPNERDGYKRGFLHLQKDTLPVMLPRELSPSEPDNQILNVTLSLARLNSNKAVVIVSRDLNFRLKAGAMRLVALPYPVAGAG